MNQLVNDASFELVTKEQVRKMILSNIYMPDSKINIVKILNLLNRNRWKMSANVRKLTQL
jgi:hypothetical protein